MQVPARKTFFQLFCAVITALAPSYKIKFNSLKSMPLLLILIALALQFICPIWFTGCNVLRHGRKRVGGVGRKRKILQAWLTAGHDTFSYLLPDLQSLAAETSVFIYEGTTSHLSALSWSQWRCIVWLWGAEWIVLLPLGHTRTNPRQDMSVFFVFFYSLHTHWALPTTLFP